METLADSVGVRVCVCVSNFGWTHRMVAILVLPL